MIEITHLYHKNMILSSFYAKFHGFLLFLAIFLYIICFTESFKKFAAEWPSGSAFALNAEGCKFNSARRRNFFA